jgi:hypothetical protein
MESDNGTNFKGVPNIFNDSMGRHFADNLKIQGNYNPTKATISKN